MVNLEDNLTLLKKAILNQDVKLLNFVNRDGKDVTLICIISKSQFGNEIIPIAEMLESNPYVKYSIR